MIHLLLKGMRYDDCTAQASTRPFIVSVKRQYFPLPHLLTPFFPDSSAVLSDLRRLTRSASAQRHVVVLAYTLLRDTTYDFARACSSDEKEPLGPCGRLARAGRIECLGRARPRAGLRRRRAHPARSGSRPPGRGDARGGPGPGDAPPGRPGGPGRGGTGGTRQHGPAPAARRGAAAPPGPRGAPDGSPPGGRGAGGGLAGDRAGGPDGTSGGADPR